MLEKFGTPLRVFTASSTELSKIEGLGDARAKKIKKMLDRIKDETEFTKILGSYPSMKLG